MINGDKVNRNLSEFEKLLTSKELRDLIKRRKLLESLNADIYVYIILFLLFAVLFSAMIFIFIQKRIVYGVIIAILDILFIEEMLFKRYTGHIFILEDGIIQGVLYKRIAKKGVRYTYLPFNGISKIVIKKDRNPRLVHLYVITKDDKTWPYYHNYGGILLPSKKIEKIIRCLETLCKKYGCMYERYI